MALVRLRTKSGTVLVWGRITGGAYERYLKEHLVHGRIMFRSELQFIGSVRHSQLLLEEWKSARAQFSSFATGRLRVMWVVALSG